MNTFPEEMVDEDVQMRLTDQGGIPFSAYVIALDETGVWYEMDGIRWFSPWANILYIGKRI